MGTEDARGKESKERGKGRVKTSARRRERC